MNIEEIEKIEEKYYANTFSRLPVAMSKGRGMYLYDVNDRRYLDMFAGIAVNSLGHCHPEIVSTIKKQSSLLMHTSNWLYTLPQLELIQSLSELTGLKKTFITNDGTEAVETAMKLARKTTNKKEIIATENAFHGRTMGALSLTWIEKYRKPFMPLIPHTKFVEYNNSAALKKSITQETAAIILEPIQGEAGIIIPDKDYLSEVREITQEKDVLLILDEVQTGFGRTGKMFAFQHSKIKPDILCLAKGLGGGFPIGATVFDCEDFEPGQHGGTFVGNPLASSVAKTVIDVITRENLPKNAEKIGNHLMDELAGMGMSVHGEGLMIGIKVEDGKKTVMDLIENGVLAIYSENTVRLLPPLIINKKHANEFLNIMDSINQ